MRLEQPSNPLTDEVLVLGENDPDRHRQEDTAGLQQPLVLIVDDDERNRNLARDVLRAAGLRTIEAASGGQGIALAIERLPDVILLDLRLPDRHGTDVARELKHSAGTAAIPVVALTAVLADDGAEWLLAGGFAGYLQKPINIREFPTQVRGYCATPERERST